tara:strand:- start:48726 stop:51332 length:2607 start_codon:yes stop_codon:yes gene_type:complete
MAQQVSGVVTDQVTNETLPGVNIVVKGTTQGVSTDIDGNYSLNVPSLSDTLIFSYIGYKDVEIPIDGRTVINIGMEQETFFGEDVVVVGYGTINKDELTTSVASVTSEDFTTVNVKDAGQLIQGKVAGLAIANPSGDPTAGTQISLRGRTTIYGTSTSPLVLIDGVPGSLDLVAPQDIESVNVLKDGSAAAIYGVRATNGVILVTTKGSTGAFQPSVNFSSFISTQQITRKLDVLTAADYRQQIADGTRAASYDLGANTDWLDEITRTPVSYVNNLSFSGGTVNTNYLVNVNWQDEEGIFVKSDNSTLRMRANLNHRMLDNKVLINVGIMNNRNEYTTTGDGYSFNGYTYRQAIIFNPTSPIKDSEGDWYQQTGNFNYENPLSRLYESDGTNHNEESRVSGTVSYMPSDALTFKAMMSFNKFNQSRGYYETHQHVSTLRDGRNGFASNGYVENTQKVLELTGEYVKNFDLHDVTLLGGYSYNEWFGRESWMTNWDFPTDAFSYNNIGAGNALKEGLNNIYSSKYLTNLIGFFGRVNYDYDNKYLLMASLRYEGASQLYGADNPWGLFPAISAGWRVTNESFMDDVEFLDELKFRAGYGVTGTPPSTSFLAEPKLGYTDYVYSDGQWIQALAPTQNENDKIKWEEKHEYNVGVDFIMLDGKLSGNVDYYVRNIEGLLYNYPVPTPPNLYNVTTANVGTMTNRGLEILLEFTPIQTKDFQWVTTANFSTNENKLKSLSNDLYETTNDYFNTGYTGEPIQTYTHRVQVGYNIGDFYGFKVVDVDDNGRWVYLNEAGEKVFYDDATAYGDFHNDANKMRLGNGIPNYYAGWNNTFMYKAFDLSVTMRGAFDYQILNFSRMYYENTSIKCTIA